MYRKNIDIDGIKFGKDAKLIHTYIKNCQEIIGRIKLNDFGYTLQQLMKWSNVSVQTLSSLSLLSVKTIQRMRNNTDYNTSIETIIALCVGMQLPPPVSRKFLELAGFRIKYSSELMAAYEYILDEYYINGIFACNELLKAMGFSDLTSEE